MPAVGHKNLPVPVTVVLFIEIYVDLSIKSDLLDRV